MPSPKTVALDFDGVLHSYQHGFDMRRLDPPEPGALEFVQKLIDEGYKVVVYSTRAKTEEGRRVIINWLHAYGFPHLAMGISPDKPPAIAYVDDRAVPYVRVPSLSGPQPGWQRALAAVHHLDEHGPHCDRIGCVQL